jgi:hypothetical protein
MNNDAEKIILDSLLSDKAVNVPIYPQSGLYVNIDVYMYVQV